MKDKYVPFHELIVLGYKANLTPTQIFERLLKQGCNPARIPSPGAIRHIGIHLIGANCRWNKHPMRSWRSRCASDLFLNNGKRRDRL